MDSVGAVGFVSIAFTAVTVIVWVDYWMHAFDRWVAHPSPAGLHVVVGGGMTVVVAVLVGIAQAVELTPPPPVDYVTVAVLSASRMVMLAVGIWMAWDRRVGKEGDRHDVPEGDRLAPTDAVGDQFAVQPGVELRPDLRR